MRKFNKQNCKTKKRDQYTSSNGFEITVIGTHAFEWTAYIKSNYSFFAVTFPNRESLKKELNNKYPKSHKQIF